MGKRKQASQWQSKMFSKYKDMVLIRGEDRADEVKYIRYDNSKKYMVDFITDEKRYYYPYEIEWQECEKQETIEDKRIYIGNSQISQVEAFIYFEEYIRIIYKNGDYQTVDSKSLRVCDKFNKIDKDSCKRYRYNLFPNKQQKENIDEKIKKSDVEEKEAGKVYAYEPDKPIKDIITYKEQKRYVDIMDIGKVEIDLKLSDYPIGNCHDIHVKKISDVYRITFYCYKRVVGIDLGEKAVVCSTGKKFELPYIELKEWKNFGKIKQQWKESVAMQLLLDYDILFFEFLQRNESTSRGFEDMLTFPELLIEKADLFNKGNPNESYKKEICTLQGKYPSSQICHICGYRNEDLGKDLQKRNWMCPYCGTKHDRDINAAINILRHGMEEKMSKDKY